MSAQTVMFLELQTNAEVLIFLMIRFRVTIMGREQNERLCSFSVY